MNYRNNTHTSIKRHATRKFSGWSYTKDGMFHTPRVKKDDKKKRTRYTRVYTKQLSRKENNQ